MSAGLEELGSGLGGGSGTVAAAAAEGALGLMLQLQVTADAARLPNSIRRARSRSSGCSGEAVCGATLAAAGRPAALVAEARRHALGGAPAAIASGDGHVRVCACALCRDGGGSTNEGGVARV